MSDEIYHLKLFVRSLEPCTAVPGQERTVESLQQLTEAGAVRFDVEVWGEALPLESTSALTQTAERLHDRVAEIRDWATRRGAEIPGFERVRTDTLVGTPREVLTLPAHLLAAYHAGELLTVAPRVENGRFYGVSDVFDRVDGLSVEDANGNQTALP